ncbi:MAG: hypothetical protein QW680_09940, partial [Pyrobaculum sp.]
IFHTLSKPRRHLDNPHQNPPLYPSQTTATQSLPNNHRGDFNPSSNTHTPPRQTWALNKRLIKRPPLHSL